jgi:hypothetical protein
VRLDTSGGEPHQARGCELTDLLGTLLGPGVEPDVHGAGVVGVPANARHSRQREQPILRSLGELGSLIEVLVMIPLVIAYAVIWSMCTTGVADDSSSG